MRRFASLGCLALATACFSPDGSALDTDDGSSSAGTDGTTTIGTSGGPDTTTNSTSAGTQGSSTTDSPLCGNGTVDDGEVCDDGVNDGAYDGCEPGCGAVGPSCGDGNINGPEECDDGVNDGAYGGCASDCTLSAFCGDDTINGPESCDDGDLNEDGANCNADCTIPGTVIAAFESDALGDFGNDTTTVTKPRFNSMSEVLVAVANNNEASLLAIDHDTLEVSRTFDPLLPNVGVRGAAIVGDTWVLAAGDCNYSIELNGTYAEVCAPAMVDRISGNRNLESIIGGYVGFEFGSINTEGMVAGYDLMGAIDGSPAPQWTVTEPAGIDWYHMAPGPMNSMFLAGSNGTYATLHQYSMSGNQIASDVLTGYDEIGRIAAGPDGSLAAQVYIAGQGVFVVGLSPQLSELWRTDDFAAGGDSHDLVIDQQGDVVQYFDSNDANPDLAKFDGQTGATVWDLALPEANVSNLQVTIVIGLSIAPDNRIWVALPVLNDAGDSNVLWLGRIAP